MLGSPFGLFAIYCVFNTRSSQSVQRFISLIRSSYQTCKAPVLPGRLHASSSTSFAAFKGVELTEYPDVQTTALLGEKIRPPQSNAST